MKQTCLTILVIFLFLPIYATTPVQSESVIGINDVLHDIDEVYGLSGSKVILKNSTHIHLFELTNNTIIDVKHCNGFLRLNAHADTVMCSNGIYSVAQTALNLLHNGPINQYAQPKTNYSIEFSGNYNSNNPECITDSRSNGYGNLVISNGSTIHKSIQLSFQHIDAYESISIKFAYIHEDSHEITLIFDQNSNQYYCASNGNLHTFTFNYSTTTSLHFTRNGNGLWGSSFGSGGSLSFIDLQNGAVALSDQGGSMTVIRLSPGANYPTDYSSYDTGYVTPICSVTAKEIGVSGDYVTLQNVDYPIDQTPSSLSCNSPTNATMIVNGELVTLWNDEDNDGYNDLNDAFTLDSTQWSDIDSDGYGDNPAGVNPDSCPSVFGTSNLDIFGCIDNDGDGVSNSGDAFPMDSTQVSDIDQDGYGDSAIGNFSDSCPTQYGTSNRNNTLGCPDQDYDGWSDLDDVFPNQSSQWADTDGDGYGDQLNGFHGDSCVNQPGSSYADRFGCLDSDGDGYSDLGDDLPYEETQWSDRDGDGYGDNNEQGANMVDYFPSDGTQWNDTDGDGHGDNPYGSQGDWFPNDPNRWQDSDQDGVANEDDAFPNNPTQSVDSDGDGYGDDPNGTDYDDFPLDANEWLDTDSDGIGDNSDQYPYDPSQSVDSDGDGFGDNTNGTRGDAFPEDGSEWLDTDGDGVGDNSDDLPFNPSQTSDADGDGFGDDPTGTGADPFPNDPTQWVDADGDGYGDNAEGNNPDLFPRDITQWFDNDGDGFGDNQNGVNPDAFPDDSTQWIDADGDGLGDNINGTNPDLSPDDFDNDGYVDSEDPFPQIASPGDKDNDGVIDDDDAFPDNFREFSDNDGDGDGDIEDLDDDNDGYLDEDEIRSNSDPLDPNSQPIEGFEVIIPGTAISLGAWDLIGIFGGVPLFGWIGFGFLTRNKRCAKYEELLKTASSRDELEKVALRWEYSLMLRMLGPHQGIRLERLRAELDDKFENASHDETEIGIDQTNLVENERKFIPPINDSIVEPTKETTATSTDETGYEWFKQGEENWYRPIGSKDEWIKFEIDAE